MASTFLRDFQEPVKSIAARFDRFVQKGDEQNSCWTWTGGPCGSGSPTFSVDNRAIKARRIAYELYRRELAPGVRLLSTCRHQKCVNPFHLEPSGSISEVSARLFEGVDYSQGQGPDGDCHEWRGMTDRYGYGQISVKNRTVTTHRIAYEAQYGAIPDGFSVLHRCDNRACVNPDHLFLGDAGDNNRDREAKGRSAPQHGENNPSAKVSPDVVRSIIADQRTHQTIAASYQISRSLVGLIKSGKRWSHVKR